VLTLMLVKVGVKFGAGFYSHEQLPTLDTRFSVILESAHHLHRFPSFLG